MTIVNENIQSLPAYSVTYSGGILSLAPASSCTDLFTISGGPGKLTRVRKIGISGFSTAVSTSLIQLLKRTTANTAGTSTNPAGTPHDANDPAPVSTLNAYTVNPSALGTVAGSIIRCGILNLAELTAEAVPALSLVWNFDENPNCKQPILRSAADVLAINLNAVTPASGAAFDIFVEWSEE